jgi:hypothetical protein
VDTPTLIYHLDLKCEILRLSEPFTQLTARTLSPSTKGLFSVPHVQLLNPHARPDLGQGGVPGQFALCSPFSLKPWHSTQCRASLTPSASHPITPRAEKKNPERREAERVQPEAVSYNYYASIGYLNVYRVQAVFRTPTEISIIHAAMESRQPGSLKLFVILPFNKQAGIFFPLIEGPQ